jgi:hypothetical protein
MAIKLRISYLNMVLFMFLRNPPILTCHSTLQSLSYNLITMLYDCIIRDSTINSVLDNPTFLFEFKNLLVDPGVCSVMEVVL